MQITKKLVDPDINVLQPDGRITVGKDCQALEAAAADLVTNGQNKAVLDMTMVSYIDSAALGTIMSCTTRLRRAGGDLRIAGPAKKVMDIFTLTGTHAVLKIHPDVTTACDSYSPAE
jgi:anti-sigma B factor antagonist